MHSDDPAPPSHPSRAFSTKLVPQQQPLPAVGIAVMGATGSGKTSFINMASGSNLRVGMDLESCTSEVQLADTFTLDGRPVILIDTPGFDDTSKSDTDILKLIAAFLETTYKRGSKLAGIIYIHRISDPRFSGIAVRNFKMFRELCGDSSLKNVILVTNMWGGVSEDVGEARERELTTNFFKPVLDKGAKIVRHHNTAQSAHNVIRRVMGNRPITLQIQRELVDEGKDITDTAAAEVINEELNGEIRRLQAELRDIKVEMKEAVKGNDEETKQELEEGARKLQEQVIKMMMDWEGMTSSYIEEKKRTEQVMRQMQEEARRERERIEAAYKQQVDDLNRRLQESANASTSERETLQQRLDKLQHQWDNRSGCIVM